MLRLSLAGLRLSLLALMLTAVSVSAQTPEAEYARHVSEALSEFELSHFEEALAQFKQAHAIFPNARTLRGLGMVEFELRRYGSSVAFLEQALASTVKPLADKLRSDTETLLERARTYIGELRLTTEPKAASLSVDGVTVSTEASRDLVLDVGEHLLEVRASGHLTQTRRVQVEGGKLQSLHVQLVRIDADAERALSSPEGEPRRADATPLRKRWWLWTTIGVVVVGGAVATAILLTRDSGPEGRPITTDNTPPASTLFALERAQ
ncbi:MAG TPA: PEGA domain-containing protein [Polyangiales bacterium]